MTHAPHPNGRPCLSCSIVSLAQRFHDDVGYDVDEVLCHIAAALAELAATTTIEGHEKDAMDVIKEVVSGTLEAAFKELAEQRAAQADAPKQPTTSDIGHA